jgi:hypothetical protein
MTDNYIKISINPLSEFMTAHEGRKRKIIKQQKNPPKIVVSWYGTARKNMKEFFKNGYDKSEIIKTIEYLQNQVPSSNFQRKNIPNSIAALKEFMALQFPDNFQKIKFEFSKPEKKGYEIEGVSINVSPDLILRWEENGIKYVGGIKFHISRSYKFTYEGSIYAASNLMLFLKEKIAKDDEVVHPDYCLSIDIFGQRVSSAPKDVSEIRNRIAEACIELKILWNKVA